MKHACANLTHFHCTKARRQHISTFFLSSHSSLPLSFSLSFSFSRAFHFITTVCPLPVISLSTISLGIRSILSLVLASLSLFLSLYARHPVQYIPTPLHVPLFLSLNFLSLTPTIHSMCLVHSQTMPRSFSRLRAIFAE